MQMLSEKVVTVLVFVFKAGIASVFGHDLKLRAKSVTCMINTAPDGSLSIDAVVDARRIEVECARSNGHDLPATTLSAADHQEIHRHLLFDVLHTDRFPEIHFSSTRVVKSEDRVDITGNLTMTGHTHQIHCRAMNVDGHFVTTFRINQPDYGIKPFSAALGALRIKPELQVEISVPATAFDTPDSAHEGRSPP